MEGQKCGNLSLDHSQYAPPYPLTQPFLDTKSIYHFMNTEIDRPHLLHGSLYPYDISCASPSVWAMNFIASFLFIRLFFFQCADEW